jgi:phosphomannomutase
MAGPHRFHPSVVRANDIRGVVGHTLAEADAYAIGRAVATIVAGRGGSTVAIGRDGRTHSAMLMDAASRGVADAGMKPLRIGLGPSPMLYFAVHHLDADGGIMVTGSHNPPEYNGFKLMIGSQVIDASAMAELVRIAEQNDYASGSKPFEDHSVRSAYVSALRERAGNLGQRVCGWDPGNGAVGAVLDELLDGLPGTHHAINVKVDGTFPAHHPDPSEVKNLQDLQRLVARESCNVGFAFDGDGDRLGVVDRKGRIVWPDQYLALLARPILKTQPGAAIIADVKASDVLFSAIRQAGGHPLMWKTGHAFIKHKLKETGAPLAGEMSGHVFFADRWFGFDDALYAALRVLDALETEGIEMDTFLDSLPSKVNTPEIRIDCADELKFSIINDVHAAQKSAQADMIDIDGVRVKTADGWWLLRASNTQPALVVRCEADDQAALDRLKQDLARLLAKLGVNEAPLFDGIEKAA